MTIAETMWLRGQAAQRDFLHLTSFGAAFAGTAALQAVHLGLTAPRGFWQAMARASGADGAPSAAARPASAGPDAAAQDAPRAAAAVASVVPMTAHAEATPAAEGAAAPPADTATPAPASDKAQEQPSPHPRDAGPDDLTALAGVGPKLARTLNEAGIYRYDQIAALDEDGIDRLDSRQRGFRMLCARHDLVGQARALR
jgi:predicted flap endonuclease-1-like 5' DNA nuclease